MQGSYDYVTYKSIQDVKGRFSEFQVSNEKCSDALPYKQRYRYKTDAKAPNMY